jgi:tetratricopeptide (TPR) repeat protein
MKKNIYLIKIIILSLFFSTNLFAGKSDIFDMGKNLFEKKEFDKSKIYFERDIVFNPMSEKSYLYLAKIFLHNENDSEEEKNLNNVLTLNPENDEAVYMLTLLKIKQTNYDEAKELMDKFNLICDSFCIKKKEIKEKFSELIPQNEKN